MQKYKIFRGRNRRKPLRSRPMASTLIHTKSTIYKREN